MRGSPPSPRADTQLRTSSWSPLALLSYLGVSLRHAAFSVANSWVLPSLLTLWAASSWGYLRRIPILGISFDFLWCLADGVDAMYKVEVLYNWMPGILQQMWQHMLDWERILKWGAFAKTAAR